MNDTVELHGQDGIEKIRALTKDIRICMMTTAGPDGSFDSRPMETLRTDPDGRFWFLTHSGSEMAAEIIKDAHVSLIYAEPKDSTYLVVKGRATISRDDSMIAELWSPMYKAWFPEGQHDPSIALLQVEITEGQYWEASSSKLLVRAKYLAAALTGGKAPVAVTGKITP